MAYYDKKVIYLSVMEYGSKVKGAGFVRMEFRGEACSLDMHISGMTELPEKEYDICVMSIRGEKCKVGKFYLHNGKGEWQKRYEQGILAEDLREDLEGDVSPHGEGLECQEIAEFIIKVSDTKVISGQTGLRKDSIKAAQIWIAGERNADEGKPEVTEQNEREEEKWCQENGRRWEFRRSEPQEQTREVVENKPEIEMDTVILNDKWDQLRQIYPVVHPYEDERDYISIQPKDFVIMTGDYQHLANNSFLLHGFYNYRHIVLGRERDGFFYLGVPGVYYEREKMVALMFGFEVFECNGGTAEVGKFGYYLRKVKV